MSILQQKTISPRFVLSINSNGDPCVAVDFTETSTEIILGDEENYIVHSSSISELIENLDIVTLEQDEILRIASEVYSVYKKIASHLG